MQAIENVKSPQVGRFYLVPYVLSTVYVRKPYGLLPVIGPLHEDAEFFNFDEEHYHIDWRFLGIGRWRAFLNDRPDPGMLYGKVISKKNVIGNVRQMPMLMKREFMPWARMINGFSKLQSRFANIELSAGLVCPHRGICLKGMKPDDHGDVVCPGHGLKWNSVSRRLVTQNVSEAF